jgi:hypothetical protein
MNPGKRDWLRASPNTDNSVPIQERIFQSAAAHRPVSWARRLLKIAPLGMASHHFVLVILICVKPDNLCLCAMLASIGEFVAGNGTRPIKAPVTRKACAHPLIVYLLYGSCRWL